MAALTMAALVFSACVSDDTYLPALLADPMGTYDAGGAELIERHTQGQGEDPIMGGTVTARVILVFAVAEDDAESALTEALAFAGESGWEMRKSTIPSATDERLVGEKDLGVGLARMVLAINRDDPAAAPGMVTLSVNLGFKDIYADNAA